MAAKKAGSLQQKKGGAGDGSHVPVDSVILDGEIVTASKACMAAVSFEHGYPVPEDYLHMKNHGKA